MEQFKIQLQLDSLKEKYVKETEFIILNELRKQIIEFDKMIVFKLNLLKGNNCIEESKLSVLRNLREQIYDLNELIVVKLNLIQKG